MDITFSSYSRLGCLSPANIIIIGSRVVVGHDVMKFALTIELELKKDENLLSQIILKTLHFHHNCLLPISIPVVVTLLRIGAILVKLSETTLKKNEIARKMKSDPDRSIFCDIRFPEWNVVQTPTPVQDPRSQHIQ